MFHRAALLPLPRHRHTHFSVDQIFSCHSRHFRSIDLPTPAKLKEELGNSYTMKDGSRPLVRDLSETADVKGWLEPFANHVQNFKDIGWFEFNLKVVGGERHCYTSVKRFASDDVYEIGRVLKELPSSQPLSAAGRPLFYLAPRVNLGVLSDSEYELRVGDARKRATDEAESR